MLLMRPEINVTNLVIETTRRCNMNCSHCLRGNAQNQDMTIETVNEILTAVDTICEVTFTGGEPTLNLNAMEHFFNESKFRGKYPANFYVATNGHENQERLAHILLKAYMDCECPSACGVSLSIDGLHDKYQSEYVKGLAFYKDVKEHLNDDPETWVIRTGRAKENGFGNPPKNVSRKFSTSISTEPNGRESIEVDTIYVSVNGFVYPDCDFSYRDMDLNKKVKIQQLRPYLYEVATGQIQEDLMTD